MTPWQVASQLTEERLVELAKRVVGIRLDALLDHDPGKGDGAWDLGTRVHQRMINQLSWAAPDLGWLEVRLEGLFISLRIDGCHLRIYRGDPGAPTDNVIRSGLRDVDEAVGSDGSLWLSGIEPPPDIWFWVMAVQTVGDGTPIRVVVAQASNAGETRHPWTVPLNFEELRQEVEAKARGKSGNVESMAKPPIEVEPVTVSPKAAHDLAHDERG